jgi:cyclophilin family peptidyl-prolyl cis-trans isomerase
MISVNPMPAITRNLVPFRRPGALLFSLLVLLAGCGGGGGDAGSSAPVAQTPSCVAAAPTPPPTPGSLDPQVTLVYANGLGVSGSVVLTLNRAKAPVTVANFLAYVNSGFYNCTVIHRLSPGFVVQGGAYASPITVGGTLPTAKATGAAIALEDGSGLSNTRLSIAMARTSAPDSATSQYFINLANNTGLDATATARGYAVFGSVTSGSAVIDAMTTAPCTAWAALVSAGECVPSPNVVLMSAVQTR